MKQHDIDAIVTIVKQAIEIQVSGLKKDLDTSDQISQIRKELAERPEPQEPRDGKDASPEQIAKAVAEYMAANPVPVPEAPKAPEPLAPTPEQIAKAVEDHMAANPLEVAADVLDGMVKEYMQANPVPIPEAPKAPEPLAPTSEQIAAEVAKHLKDNPPASGARGMDAVEITILDRIDPARRYAKGTYAKHDGGLWRAAMDTDGMEGWDVVIRGVSAVEVTQSGLGEFEIKTILTGGASHVTKAALPFMQYAGVWKESHGEYSKGFTATHAGSLWHCNEATADKPGTSEAWTLCAKAGKDGKDITVARLPKPEVYKL